MANPMNDDRFSQIYCDPRFKPVPNREKKIKIDKRFKGMLKDKNFNMKYVMDKRGRPLQQTNSEDLKKLYDLSSSESDECENDEASEELSKSLSESKIKVNNKDKFKSIKAEESKTLMSSSESETDSGQGVEEEKENSITEGSDESENEDSTSSESETTSSEDELEQDENKEFDHKWGELHTDAPTIEDATHRLAACNLDWDRIKAQDLLVLFTSFKPPDGVVKSVKIYLSDYGRQRIKHEELHGPTELVDKKIENDKNEEETKDIDKSGSRYRMEKLRQYQLNRLRYYYAVVECDSVQTANALYEEMDGMEYESSSTSLDLRFIPNDVTFEEEPVGIAEALPDLTNYKPKQFTTTALQQVKVNLTWDETDPNRLETMQRAFIDAENTEKDIQAYLASSSSAESEDDENDSSDASETESKPQKKSKALEERISKYKSLLLSLEEEDGKQKHEQDVEMEFTWEPGLKETTEELIKNKHDKEENSTPWEQFLQKKKQQKKQRKKEMKQSNNFSEDESSSGSSGNEDEFFEKPKAKQEKTAEKNSLSKKSNADELGLLVAGESKTGNNSENVERKKKKKKEKKLIKDDGFEVNTKDERFAAVFTSHLYNIDPSDSHYKETKGMRLLLDEKQRQLKAKSERSGNEFSSSNYASNISQEASQLVNSVKRKAEKMQYNKTKFSRR